MTILYGSYVMNERWKKILKDAAAGGVAGAAIGAACGAAAGRVGFDQVCSVYAEDKNRCEENIQYFDKKNSYNLSSHGAGMGALAGAGVGFLCGAVLNPPYQAYLTWSYSRQRQQSVGFNFNYEQVTEESKSNEYVSSSINRNS